MPADIDKICQTLDKLTLDALTLMEEEIRLKLNVENSMVEGESNLAKTRYIMGQSSVTALQLPTENSPESDAIIKVNSNDDVKLFEQKSLELELVQKSDNSENVQDPIKWFGYLVPKNLNLAQSNFRQALHWVVQAVNIQKQLSETCNKIGQLKELKKEMISSNL